MKPGSFDFLRARSIEEASRLLLQADGAGRVIAGAQSLAPMLNLRLARPQLLVDITGIPELTRIEDPREAVIVGACVTSANIEDGRLPGPGFETLPAIAARIAYRAVRNRGTIGGSLCHADPAADWVCVVCALEAECLVADAKGKRWLPADQFITGAYETALAPCELLEAIRLPRRSQRARLGFFKVARKAGEFALAMAAVMHDPQRRQLRVAIGATAGRPIVIADASGLFRSNGSLDEGEAARVLDRHAVGGRTARRQQLAALAQACDQAMRP
jgi:aerobic carbon-monoxide dehydrogenase medium subunit